MRTLSFAALLLLACTKAAAPPDAGEPAPKRKGDQDVQPVYAPTAKAEPLAVRTCRALHGVRAERRTACCGGPLMPNLPESECVKTLSQSLQTGAVRVPEEQLKACEAATQRAYEGCEWPGPDDTQPPAACTTVIDGTLDAGASCRSSLECQSGLHCAGAGPTDFGRCGPPSKATSLCALAVDPLGAFTAQRLDDLHPECAGACDHHRCVDALGAGAACVSSLQCGPGRHCAAEKGCAEGAFAKQGESCLTGGCEGELRCIGGRCAAARTRGEHCEFDSECIGGCIRDGGVCAPKCR